jgi:hypothetical protein
MNARTIALATTFAALAALTSAAPRVTREATPTQCVGAQIQTDLVQQADGSWAWMIKADVSNACYPAFDADATSRLFVDGVAFDAEAFDSHDHATLFAIVRIDKSAPPSQVCVKTDGTYMVRERGRSTPASFVDSECKALQY